jgi:hypothetical protein
VGVFFLPSHPQKNNPQSSPKYASPIFFTAGTELKQFCLTGRHDSNKKHQQNSEISMNFEIAVPIPLYSRQLAHIIESPYIRRKEQHHVKCYL